MISPNLQLRLTTGILMLLLLAIIFISDFVLVYSLIVIGTLSVLEFFNLMNKIFVKKWGLTINFFEKFYLKSGIDQNKDIIMNKYDGPLTEPKFSIEYLLGLIKCKLLSLYLFFYKANID